MSDSRLSVDFVFGVLNTRRASSAARRSTSSSSEPALSVVDMTDLAKHPAVALALGNMVVVWSRAETAMMVALAWATKMPVDMTSSAFYHIPTFDSRVKMLLAVLSDCPVAPSLKAAMIHKIEALSRLSKTRNTFVHHTWIVDENTNNISIVDHRKPPRSRITPVKSIDIMNHVVAVRKRTMTLEGLFDWTDLVFSSPHTLP